jgi:hypothetical protein
MKLFLYDDKRQRVNAEMDLGLMTPDEISVATSIMQFLEEHDVTNRYQCLRLADQYVVTYAEGEAEVEFLTEKELV